MRKLASLTAAVATILLLGSMAAYAQQKATPDKAQGAGAECSRMTDAKARDACVHQAQQKGTQTKTDAKNKASSAKSSASKDMKDITKGK